MWVNKRFIVVIIFIILSVVFCKGNQTSIALDSLIKEIEQQSDTQKTEAYLSLSWKYNTSQPKLAYKYAFNALQLAIKLSLPEKIAEAHNCLGVAYFYLGEYEYALEQYNAALLLGINLNNKMICARSFTNIALIYEMKGNYDKAIQYLFKALSLHDNIENSKQLAEIYANIGYLYYKQGYTQYPKSLDYYYKALKIYEKLKNNKGIASTNDKIGNLFHEKAIHEPANRQVNLNQALLYHENAMQIRQMRNDTRGIATSLLNIGIIYAEFEMYDKAEEKFKEAIKISMAADDKTSLVHTYYNYGYLKAQEKKYADAVKNYNLSIQYAIPLDYKEWLATNYYDLAEVFATMQQYKDAYYNLNRYVKIKDTLFNAETYNKIAEIQNQFEIETHRKEIALLRKENDLQAAKMSKQSQLFLLSLFISLLVVVLLVIIYRSYKRKREDSTLLKQQNLEILQQKEEIMTQRDEIELRNKITTDSIRYARRIQDEICPSHEHIIQWFPEYFILSLPKDIVSGDFHWMSLPSQVKMQTDPALRNQVFFSVIDCTGHGVSGAFMSIIGYNLLNRAIKERHLLCPAAFLNFLDKELKKIFHKKNSNILLKEGMDLAICKYDKHAKILEYAGSCNPMIIFRAGQIIEVKGEGQPLGITDETDFVEYTSQSLQLQEGDILYLFSDGYIHQFGGAFNRKISNKGFKNMIKEMQFLPMKNQQEYLYDKFKEWKGAQLQIDDVLIWGIKI